MKAYTLVGIDGNAYNIMGYVRDAMHDAEMTNDDIDSYIKDATSSDYNHLLAVSCEMIDRVNEILGLNDYDEDEDEDYYMDEYSVEEALRQEEETLLKELHACIDRINNRYLDQNSVTYLRVNRGYLKGNPFLFYNYNPEKVFYQILFVAFTRSLRALTWIIRF